MTPIQELKQKVLNPENDFSTFEDEDGSIYLMRSDLLAFLEEIEQKEKVWLKSVELLQEINECLSSESEIPYYKEKIEKIFSK